MSTYKKDDQKLVSVSKTTPATTQQQQTNAAAKQNTTQAQAQTQQTTAAATQPFKYDQQPVDRTQYEYDPTTNDAYMQALDALEAAKKNMPTYAATYDAKLDEIYNQIINRKPFEYDVNEDMLYQQYKDQYTTLGQQAMRDTMGQAAALTGGYGSSYAQSVGQQQYDAYLKQLNEVVPELYGMAQDQYYREGEALQQQFAMTGELSDREYGRYQDAMNNYWQNVTYNQGVADSARDFGSNNWWNAQQMGMQQDQFNYQQYLDQYDRDYQRETDIWNQNFQREQFDHQKDQDAIGNDQWERSFASSEEQRGIDNAWRQTEFDNDNYWLEKNFNNDNSWREKEFTYGQSQDAYEKQLNTYNRLAELITATGYTPSAAELQAAGMSQSQADAYKNYYTQNSTPKSTGSGSGGGYYETPIGDGDGGGNNPKAPVVDKNYNPVNYDEAVANLKENGITDTSELLDLSTWSKNRGTAQVHYPDLMNDKNSNMYKMYGSGYENYLRLMMAYYYS